jgi:F-type H+-transporting ATPase subunit gamma
MSETTSSLRHKISSAQDLKSVVRTMKALAASSISQYEKAVSSLEDYYRTVRLGLVACLRQTALNSGNVRENPGIGVVVFGSDQGLVGQFNDLICNYALQSLTAIEGKKTLWVVGERVQSRLADNQLIADKTFILPNAMSAITPLVGQVLTEIENHRAKGDISQVYLFYNRPKAGAMYEPVSQRLLPLDKTWQHELSELHWATNNLPQVLDNPEQTLKALIREYLFVSLFKACTESLASENASRLAAMQRAEKNIDELQDELNRSFHQLRQTAIDEELFDVISGFEALTKSAPPVIMPKAS